MIAEFEEKEYEQNLNFELLYKKGLMFSPGQVLENTLGFDVALFSRNRDFWKLFPHHHRYHRFRFFRHFEKYFWDFPYGIHLETRYWQDLQQHFNDPDYFPQIKFNVFVQHKRPDYLASNSASEWKHWNKPYFRYLITNHQQKALEFLEQKIGNSGIVTYACAAFYQRKELWNASKNGKLIENSNFCQASKLVNHKKYTYSEAGNQGIGFSEPENIISFNFNEKIKQLSQIKGEGENSNKIKKLSNDIIGITQEIKELQELTKDFNEVYPFPDELKQFEIAKNFRDINIFNYLTKSVLMFGIENDD